MLRLRSQVLERRFIEKTANHEISAGSKQARLQNLCRRVELPTECSLGLLLEQFSRHLLERGGLSRSSMGPLDRWCQRLSRALDRRRQRVRGGVGGGGAA